MVVYGLRKQSSEHLSGKTSFTNYINQRFYQEIFEAIKVYSFQKSEEMTGMTIKWSNVEDSSGMALTFEIIVGELFQSIQNSCDYWFRLSCKGNLEKQLDDFKIVQVQDYNGQLKRFPSLSNALIPYIRRDQLDEVASTLVKQHYPSVLRLNHMIEPIKLVKQLGLKLKFRKLTPDGSVLGETIFSDTKVEIYNESLGTFIKEEIGGGTILIDPNNYLSRNTGSVNNTIIHECVHWLLHRKAFALEQLFNPKARGLRSVSALENKSTIEWIEWQAKALTPRIQMPFPSLKRKAKELRKVYHYLNGRRANRIGEMEYLIDGLASFFRVSKAAAKIRLLDIEIEETRGIYKFIDGQYIPSYVFEQGTLSPTQTFSICLQDAIAQSVENPKLRAELEIGKYLFVESHFCLNTPKYLRINPFGKAELTRYARLHMEECCLIFKLLVKDPKESATFEAVLYRDANSDITFEVRFANEKNVSENILIRKRLIELQQVVLSLPGSFSGTVEALIKWSELTIEKVTERTLLSEKTLYRIRTDENYNPSMEAIIQLSIGLQLPPELSSILIARSTKRLGNSELHFLYRFLLNCCYMSSIYDCNEILESQDFKRIGKEI